MYVIGLPDAPSPLRESLTSEMEQRGAVGTIEVESQMTQVQVEEAWTVVVDDSALREGLDVLAPRCDYAIVSGSELERGPNLVVRDGVLEGSLLEDARQVHGMEVEELVDRLEDTEPYVTLESLVAQLKKHTQEDRAGAIATFTGRVRAKEAPDDTPTKYLEFEQYGEIAHDEMEHIRQELIAREDVFEVLMHHRSGVIHPGEDIVFVVVLAGHREQAFETVEDGINRLKAEVPIFKKEVTVDEEFWVHMRP